MPLENPQAEPVEAVVESIDIGQIVTEAVRAALDAREQAEPAVRAAGIAVPAVIVKDEHGESDATRRAFRAWQTASQTWKRRRLGRRMARSTSLESGCAPAVEAEAGVAAMAHRRHQRPRPMAFRSRRLVKWPDGDTRYR